MMKLNEAIDYLQQIADSTPLTGYSEALAVALDAMREVERLRGELKDEKYRHDRQCDFTVGQSQLIDRLKAMEKAFAMAEKEGRIVVLPCRVGDTVYRVWKTEGREPHITAHYMLDIGMVVRWMHRFGKTVFTTYKDAERALEDMNCEDE